MAHWYLMDVGSPINGLQIKQRYGKAFEAAKRYQNLARYVIYPLNGHEGYAERWTLRSAKKHCRDFRKKGE